MVILSGNAENLAATQGNLQAADVGLKVLKEEFGCMVDLVVFCMSIKWAGHSRAGWGDSDLSDPYTTWCYFLLIGGTLGLIAGLFPCIDSAGYLENKAAFHLG